MRRARVIGTMALVASMAAVPMAVAAGGHNGPVHHPPARVHYGASGVADANAVCSPSLTPGVTLDNTQFKPMSIGTNGSQLAVVFGGSTKFVGHRGHALACASIKKGDRLTVVWTEPATIGFSKTLPATRVVDNGQPHHHV
jgi:hypothetical protein